MHYWVEVMHDCMEVMHYCVEVMHYCMEVMHYCFWWLQDSINTDDESQIIQNYHYESATTNIHPYLSSLVNYIQPVKFQGFDVAEGMSSHYGILKKVLLCTISEFPETLSQW